MKADEILEQLLQPDIPFPHKMTQAEEEMLKGASKPSERSGRLPIFYRAEVEQIRADTRAPAVIAAAWGVAFDTIQRVRQAGRFRNVPYIPRDEIDRRQGQASEQKAMSHYQTTPVHKRGRPFKSGRETPLSEEEILSIVSDQRQATIVAAEYSVSTSYVNNLKSKAGLSAKGRTMTPDKVKAIIADQRDPALISRDFKVPKAVVEALKRGAADADRGGA